jgi:hypothetical protein
MLSGDKERTPHNRSSKKKKEEKGYEKNNLFGWHGFAFCFAGHDELRPCTKDNAYEEQCPDAKRKLAGVDDL